MSIIYHKLDSRGIDGVLGTESELQCEHLSLKLTIKLDNLFTGDAQTRRT
jgi:hypothetical protein